MGCGRSKSSQVVHTPLPVKPGPVFEQPSKPGPVLELPSKALPSESSTKQAAAPSKPAPTPPAKDAPVKPAAAPAASTSAQSAQSPRFIRVEADFTEYGTKVFAGEIADKVAKSRAPRAPLTLS